MIEAEGSQALLPDEVKLIEKKLGSITSTHFQHLRWPGFF